MEALEAGRNGMLEYVGQGAVTACPALGSLVLGGAERPARNLPHFPLIHPHEWS